MVRQRQLIQLCGHGLGPQCAHINKYCEIDDVPLARARVVRSFGALENEESVHSETFFQRIPGSSGMIEVSSFKAAQAGAPIRHRGRYTVNPMSLILFT